MIKIDTWYEILITGGIILAALVIILQALGRVLARGGKLKAGSLEAGGPGACPPVEEHNRILAELKAGQVEQTDLLNKVLARVEQNDTATGALIENARIMQKYVRRELGRALREEDTINGDLDEADREIARAQKVYREGRRLVS